MLCLSGEAGYVTEPFNYHYNPPWVRRPFPYQSLYICPENESGYAASVDAVMKMRYPLFRNLVKVRSAHHAGRLARDWRRSARHRLKRVRPLIKDPYALFSSEWLAHRYDMQVVVMIRHPAGFASSIKRLNWKRNFRHWAEQDLLLRDLLTPFADEIKEFAERNEEVDILDRAILMWNCYYHVVDNFRRVHPEWVFVKYEDLAADAVGGFERLYGELDLTWSDEVARKVGDFSSEANVKEVPTSQSPHVIKRDSKSARFSWAKRLSEDEIERIRRGTAEVAGRFYDEADWEIPRSSEAVR